MNELKNRIDFVYIFDVKDGNPNGDPDAGNLPRVDAETGMGIVTDVCLKRKVRNYVQTVKDHSNGYDIYIKEKAILGHSHIEAYKSLGYSVSDEAKPIPITEQTFTELSQTSLPSWFSIDSEENDEFTLTIDGIFDKKDATNWLNDSDFSKEVKKELGKIINSVKQKSIDQSKIEGGRKWMCEHFYDIRTFGAVLSLKTAPNCGQVRGAIQLTFSRSIDPITIYDHSITRMAVASEKEAKKQNGENRTMGRKATVPYGLYVCHGFISPSLAKQTGFSEEDLELFWEALKNMFDLDHSAARGLMSAQKLIVFKHDSALGNAPANKLFDLVKVEKVQSDVIPRSFADYKVTIDTDKLPSGVTMEELI